MEWSKCMEWRWRWWSRGGDGDGFHNIHKRNKENGSGDNDKWFWWQKRALSCQFFGLIFKNQEKQWLKKVGKEGEAKLSICLEFTYTKDASIK